MQDIAKKLGKKSRFLIVIIMNLYCWTDGQVTAGRRLLGGIIGYTVQVILTMYQNALKKF